MRMSEWDKRKARERSAEFKKDRKEVIEAFKKDIMAHREKPHTILAIPSLGIRIDETVHTEIRLGLRDRLEETDQMRRMENIYIDGMPDRATEYFSERTWALHKELCRKWDLGRFGPYTDKSGTQFIWLEPETNNEAIREQFCSEGYDDFLQDQSWSWEPTGDGHYALFFNHCVSVHLLVNLNKTERELKYAFAQKLRQWKQQHNSKKVRTGLTGLERNPRKTTYDPWQIFDLYQSGKPLNKIALQMSGKNPPPGKRTPAYNDELWGPYKRTKRAYDRAIQMIKAVEEEVHGRTKERQELHGLLQTIGRHSKELRASHRRRTE